MSYKQMKRIFHEDSSSSRYASNSEEALRRINDVSSTKTGIYLKTGELFFTAPPELTTLLERVLRLERKITQLWKALPLVAKKSYVLDLIIQEIYFTNEIEGIRSTRKQIKEALYSVEASPKDDSQKRFREFARLYLGITKDEISFPATPRDIRKIYDVVLEGEIESSNELDGELFRTQGVDVRAGHRIVHEGVTPEEKIIEMLQQMIDFVEREDIPAVFSSLLSHFVFEYIHPFYDGNGRMGRFLLALYLSRPLSIPTVLLLSSAISDGLPIYYRAFEDTEDSLNHAEGTHFLIEMMRLIRTAQEDMIMELESRRAMLDAGTDAIGQFGLDCKTKEAILYILLQAKLFDINRSYELGQIAEHLGKSKATARKYLGELESENYVEFVSLRPLRARLTDDSFARLDIR